MKTNYINGLSPSEVLKARGYPPIGSMPANFAEGPFDFSGTLDFDAAAHTVVCDMLEFDNFDDVNFVRQLQGASEDKPSIVLAIAGIEVVFIEQTFLEHADPEDVRRVIEGIYLEMATMQTTDLWPVRDGCHAYAKPGGVATTNLTVEVRSYQYPTEGIAFFPEGTIIAEMGALKTLAIKATAAAAGSLLGANADVIVRVHGCAWDVSYKGWDEDKETCGQDKSPKEAMVDFDERKQAQDAMRARALISRKY